MFLKPARTCNTFDRIDKFDLFVSDGESVVALPGVAVFLCCLINPDLLVDKFWHASQLKLVNWMNSL